jgi:polygalacturonase
MTTCDRPVEPHQMWPEGMTAAHRRSRAGKIFRLLSLAALWSAAEAWCAESVFNVLNYGAHNDSSAPATEAIRSAIQAAKSGGGGTVVIPAGSYVCGPIELVSNLVLRIEAGAVLTFPAVRLPYAPGRVQGIECLTPVPLIGGDGLENVTITGRGTIATSNEDWTRLMGGPQPKTATSAGSAFGPAWNELLAALQKKTPQPESEYLKVAPLLRPAFIRTRECHNVLIEGIRMVGTPFWSIHLLYSANVVVRGISLETFPGAFTGGIYIDSSRDVRVSDCYLDCGDDAIALKAGKDADGLRVNRPTENVSIANCLIRRGSGGIVIGSETSGGIRNVVVSNIVCQGTQAGINIKSERGRGGIVENVRLDNLVFDDVGRAISVSQYYTMQGETPPPAEPVSQRTPVFRNISISRVTISHARGRFDFGWNPVSISGNQPGQPVMIAIAGLPEMPIEGLRLSDIVAGGAGGLRASDTAGLELTNVQVDPDAAKGPVFLIKDSSGLRLNHVSTRVPTAGTPVVRLDRCAGASVEGVASRGEGGALVSVGPGEMKGMQFGSGQTTVEEKTADFWAGAEKATQ